MAILSNLRLYLELGTGLAVAVLLGILKFKNMQIGRLTVDKILAEASAKQVELDKKLKEEQEIEDRARKAYEEAMDKPDFTNNSH